MVSLDIVPFAGPVSTDAVTIATGVASRLRWWRSADTTFCDALDAAGTVLAAARNVATPMTVPECERFFVGAGAQPTRFEYLWLLSE